MSLGRCRYAARPNVVSAEGLIPESVRTAIASRTNPPSTLLLRLVRVTTLLHPCNWHKNRTETNLYGRNTCLMSTDQNSRSCRSLVERNHKPLQEPHRLDVHPIFSAVELFEISYKWLASYKIRSSSLPTWQDWHELLGTMNKSDPVSYTESQAEWRQDASQGTEKECPYRCRADKRHWRDYSREVYSTHLQTTFYE